MARKKFIRVFVGSDMHCGHLAGLTPPAYWYQSDSKMASERVIQSQRDLWGFYVEKLDKYRPFHVAILNGDLIDGVGSRSGGVEQITTDCQKQCQMAEVCCATINAQEYYLVYGTDYHTGTAEDWENIIAGGLNAERIGSHLFIPLGNMMFDVKHHLGSSSVPYGDATQPNKEMTWNQIIASNDGEQPRADVIIRSHVHKYVHIDKEDTHVFVTPGLQGWGSRYGKRRISRSIDFGFLVLDIYPDKELQYHVERMKGILQRVEVAQSKFSTF